MISAWSFHIGWGIKPNFSLLTVQFDFSEVVPFNVLQGNWDGEGQAEQSKEQEWELEHHTQLPVFFQSREWKEWIKSARTHNFSKQAGCQLQFWKFNQENLFLTSSSCLWLDCIALWWVKCSPNFRHGQDSSSEQNLFSKLPAIHLQACLVLLCFAMLHPYCNFTSWRLHRASL